MPVPVGWVSVRLMCAGGSLLSFLTMVVEFGRRMVPGRGMTRGKKGHVEVIDGREKDVGGVVVTPRTSFTAV